jgi:Tfp pilus assembly protein PilN
VRITAFKPAVDDTGGLVVQISVVARAVDDVDELIRNLEATGSFTRVRSSEEHFNNDGMLEAKLEGNYVPPAAPAAAPRAKTP